MSAYELQEYLNFLATQLTTENKAKYDFTERATRIQDYYLYRKEARARQSLHGSTRDRAPRYDKRSHKFQKKKKYPAYKVEKSREIAENLKAKEMTDAVIQKASSFHVKPPSFIDMHNKVQRHCWLDSVNKVAAAGCLLANNGKPAYDYLISEYLSNLNDFGARRRDY